MKKKKLARILGVVLTVTLLASLFGAALPAAAGDDYWGSHSIIGEGSTKGWDLAKDTVNPIGLGPLAIGPTGDLWVYSGADGAKVSPSSGGAGHAIMKSTTGGYSFSEKTGASGVTTDPAAAVVDFATSPEDANVVYYTTGAGIWKSADGGGTWAPLSTAIQGSGNALNGITSIDVAKIGDTYVVVAAANPNTGAANDIYLYDESKIVPSWEPLSMPGAGTHTALEIGLSPKFVQATNRTYIAITTDGTNTYINIKVGGAVWNTTVARGTVAGVVATSASIAFPGDFDYITGPILYVGLDTSGTGPVGDVYQLIGGTVTSTARDTGLNVDIASVAARGSAASAHVLAGAAGASTVYYSPDGAFTYTTLFKQPTGSNDTHVAMDADFVSTGEAWAASGGADGGLSHTTDYGKTWNQTSLINTVIVAINDVSVNDAGIFFMTTEGSPTTVTTGATAAVPGDDFTITAGADADTVIITANATAIQITVTTVSGSTSAVILTNNSGTAMVVGNQIFLGPTDVATLSATSNGTTGTLAITNGPSANVTAVIGNDTDGDALVTGATPPWGFSLPDGSTSDVATVTENTGSVAVTMSGSGTAVEVSNVWTITFAAAGETALVSPTAAPANVTFVQTVGSPAAVLTTDTDTDVTLNSSPLAVGSTVTPGATLILPDAGVTATSGTTTTVIIDSIFRQASEWERVFSSMTYGAADMVEMSPDNSSTSAVFATNANGTTIWRSLDNGQRWLPQVTAVPNGVMGWLVVDQQTVITGKHQNINRTTNNGLSWISPPSMSSTGGNYISDFTMKDGKILAGSSLGFCYYSSNLGETWAAMSGPAGSGGAYVQAYPAIGDDGKLYATQPNGGVWRYKSGATWNRIDLASAGSDTIGSGTGIAAAGGSLYVIDNISGEAMKRSIDPTDDVSGTSTDYPFFEQVDQTSSATVTGTLNKLWSTAGSVKLWTVRNGTGVYVYVDRLAIPVADLEATTDPLNISKVDLSWTGLDKISRYTWQIDTREDFTGGITATGTSIHNSAPSAATLTGGRTYYARVRGDSPVLTRWSDTVSFVMELGQPTSSSLLTAPAPGAQDVSINPIFQWGMIAGATGYEFQLTDDPGFFATPSLLLESATPTVNYYTPPQGLAYGTTYYWRTRALGTDTNSAWTNGVFTTEAKPVEDEQIVITEPGETVIKIVEVPIQTIIEQPIPSYLLVTVIIIGAILIVALIILIVRTRRVA